MEVVLDTNFILTCLKNGIDFTKAEEFGKVVIPREVLEELEKLSAGRSRNNSNAVIALAVINSNKKLFRFISLGRKFADAGIINYAKNKKIIVATLDRELKRALKNKAEILAIRGKKKLILA